MSHRDPMDLPAFRAWFGQSAVVDGKGRPLVVYRGDRLQRWSFAGEDGEKSRVRGNLFFTSDPAVARGYTPGGWRENRLKSSSELAEQDGMYRVFLSIQRPLVLEAKGESWSSIPVPVSLQDRLVGATQMQIDDLAEKAREMGFDGLIVREVQDQFGEADQFVVFQSGQIKSAMHNRGTFDAQSPDIRLSAVPRQRGV